MSLNFSEKERKRFLAIMKAMKQQKGFVINKNELIKEIQNYQDIEKEVDSIKEQYNHVPAAVQEADLQKKKLQGIIKDLNEYMQILHPEGLLEMGKGSSGKSVMGQG